MAIKKERLLRLAIAHYRNPDVTEADVHHFIQTDHALKAARVHAKYGLVAYGFGLTATQLYSPSPLRKYLTDLCNTLQNGWIIDDREITVEFYFRDVKDLFKIAGDPEFKAIQAEEGPYIRSDKALATMTWVETYIENGKVVNVDENGRYTYGTYADQSVI